MIICIDLIRYEKVVTSRDLLHDMSLNQVIFQNCHPIVNQDWWLGCLQKKSHT